MLKLIESLKGESKYKYIYLVSRHGKREPRFKLEYVVKSNKEIFDAVVYLDSNNYIPTGSENNLFVTKLEEFDMLDLEDYQDLGNIEIVEVEE